MPTAKQRPTAAAPPLDPAELSPLELHALAIAAKPAAKCRDDLAPGSDQAVDFVVRVRGQLTVGDTQTAIVTKKPDAETILAHVFATMTKAGQAKAFEHLASLADLDELPAADSAAVTLARQAIQTLALETQQPRRGNVTGQLSVERRKR